MCGIVHASEHASPRFHQNRPSCIPLRMFDTPPISLVETWHKQGRAQYIYIYIQNKYSYWQMSRVKLFFLTLRKWAWSLVQKSWLAAINQLVLSGQSLVNWWLCQHCAVNYYVSHDSFFPQIESPFRPWNQGRPPVIISQVLGKLANEIKVQGHGLLHVPYKFVGTRRANQGIDWQHKLVDQRSTLLGKGTWLGAGSLNL